ncbi:hypothetical protein TSAR_005448 [Trichomalopsis sarcophagae]|uniref:Uncharacterized protein n=1 Tax=Trichomalopsis sarcophagae TaxID=543379 RepID=A0A232EP49_9HYME|nr:hypothetical protein TSAR_005448 [Trichomalopsis sarcophagae]
MGQRVTSSTPFTNHYIQHRRIRTRRADQDQDIAGSTPSSSLWEYLLLKAGGIGDQAQLGYIFRCHRLRTPHLCEGKTDEQEEQQQQHAPPTPQQQHQPKQAQQQLELTGGRFPRNLVSQHACEIGARRFSLYNLSVEEAQAFIDAASPSYQQRKDDPTRRSRRHNPHQRDGR